MLFLLPNQRCQSTERLAHSDYGQDAKVLLNGVTCIISVPEFSYTTPQPIYGPFSESTWVSRCENFWTLWCKGRLRQADTVTIRLATTLTGLTSTILCIFLHAACPSCRPTNRVKALTLLYEINNRRLDHVRTEQPTVLK